MTDSLNKSINKIKKITEGSNENVTELFANSDLEGILKDVQRAVLREDTLDQIKSSLDEAKSSIGKSSLNELESSIDKAFEGVYETCEEIVGELVNTYIDSTSSIELETNNGPVRQRKERFSFEKMGIKVGEKLTFRNDPTIEVIVTEGNKVILDGETMSLGEASKRGLNQPYLPNNSLINWEYKEKMLETLRQC